MDSDQAKLFIGGISWETNEEAIKEHFQGYGVVLGSVIARDRVTRNPRGFGFVSFSDPSSADKALQEKHVILGRTVDVKRAVPRSEQVPNQQQSRGVSKSSRTENGNPLCRTKKIFVGGLSANLTKEEFKNYFEKFGKITDVVVMHDSTTHRPRGFGFITYDLEESVENVMQNNFHELNGRRVEVKRAVPKEGNNNSDCNCNMRTGGRGSPHSNNHLRIYPQTGPSYAILPGYAPLTGYGVGGDLHGTWCPVGAYGAVGYEVTPPRAPWYGPMVIGVRAWASPGGDLYPTYMNSGLGLSGIMAGNGIVDSERYVRSNQEVFGSRNVQAGRMLSKIEG